MTATAIIILIFFVIIIATISFEAAFRSESKENFDNGTKNGETNYDDLKKSVQTFDVPELDEPNKD